MTQRGGKFHAMMTQAQAMGEAFLVIASSEEQAKLMRERYPGTYEIEILHTQPQRAEGNRMPYFDPTHPLNRPPELCSCGHAWEDHRDRVQLPPQERQYPCRRCACQKWHGPRERAIALMTVGAVALAFILLIAAEVSVLWYRSHPGAGVKVWIAEPRDRGGK